MTTTRPLTPAERQAIAARYGATCDLPAVTVCPPCVYTAQLALSEWQAKTAAKARKRGLAKMQGSTNLSQSTALHVIRICPAG